MLKVITATEFRRNVPAVVDEVAGQKLTCIVTRYGKPEAVLITFAEYQRLTGAGKSDASATDANEHRQSA
jgi:prevent-host-death family protein